MNNTPKLLTEAIKDENVHGLLVELGEVAIDATIMDGIMKDVPLLGSILGITKTALSIKDKLFCKKLRSFLLQIESIDEKIRTEQIERIENDPKYKTKVGENLLYIIDKCDGNEKAIYVGQLFRYYLEQKIDYNEFLRASKCVESVFAYDLKRFIVEEWDVKDIEDCGDLVASGLMTLYYLPDQQTWANVGNGTLKAKRSSIGRKIQELLS